MLEQRNANKLPLEREHYFWTTPRRGQGMYNFYHLLDDGVGLNCAKYWKAVENASLLPDLQVLADGDLTEVKMQQFTCPSA